MDSRNPQIQPQLRQLLLLRQPRSLRLLLQSRQPQLHRWQQLRAQTRLRLYELKIQQLQQQLKQLQLYPQQQQQQQQQQRKRPRQRISPRPSQSPQSPQSPHPSQPRSVNEPWESRAINSARNNLPINDDHNTNSQQQSNLKGDDGYAIKNTNLQANNSAAGGHKVMNESESIISPLDGSQNAKIVELQQQVKDQQDTETKLSRENSELKQQIKELRRLLAQKGTTSNESADQYDQGPSRLDLPFEAAWKLVAEGKEEVRFDDMINSFAQNFYLSKDVLELAFTPFGKPVEKLTRAEFEHAFKRLGPTLKDVLNAVEALKALPNFKPHLTTQEAEQELKMSDKPDYIIRYSKSEPTLLAWAYRNKENKIVHVKIQNMQPGYKILLNEPVLVKSVTDLVNTMKTIT